LIDGPGGPHSSRKQLFEELVHLRRIGEVDEGDVDKYQVADRKLGRPDRGEQVPEGAASLFSGRAWNIGSGLVDRKLPAEVAHAIHHNGMADRRRPLGKPVAVGDKLAHGV